MRVRAQCSVGKSAIPSITTPAGPGGWWIIDEPELHLGEVVPDLAGWRRERMVELPERERVEHLFTLYEKTRAPLHAKMQPKPKHRRRRRAPAGSSA